MEDNKNDNIEINEAKKSDRDVSDMMQDGNLNQRQDLKMMETAMSTSSKMDKIKSIFVLIFLLGNIALVFIGAGMYTKSDSTVGLVMGIIGFCCFVGFIAIGAIVTAIKSKKMVKQFAKVLQDAVPSGDIMSGTVTACSHQFAANGVHVYKLTIKDANENKTAVYSLTNVDNDIEVSYYQDKGKNYLYEIKENTLE